jgi:hypothetical protein
LPALQRELSGLLDGPPRVTQSLKVLSIAQMVIKDFLEEKSLKLTQLHAFTLEFILVETTQRSCPDKPSSKWGQSIFFKLETKCLLQDSFLQGFVRIKESLLTSTRNPFSMETGMEQDATLTTPLLK